MSVTYKDFLKEQLEDEYRGYADNTWNPLSYSEWITERYLNSIHSKEELNHKIIQDETT